MPSLIRFKRWLSRDIGQINEDIARQYLIKQGLRFIVANYHCRYGELDLIMADHTVLVFVEVKFRRNHSHGGAAAAVNHSKQRKLIKTAQWYMQQQGLSNNVTRFDVIAIEGDDSQIRWIKNAFHAD
ncbi:MAG: putative endonuclease [Phenylobacterium sp.]|jgi:putative endonuclease